MVAHATAPHDKDRTSKPKKILILYSFYDQVPWQNEFKKGLRHILSRQRPKSILYEESLDATRFSNPETKKRFLELLKSKYNKKSIDLIVTESGPASDFLSRHPAFLEQVPRLFINPSPAASHSLHKNEQNKILTIKDNLPEALRQIQTIFQPKKIIIVGETKTDISRQLIDEIKSSQKESNSSVAIEYLLDLPIKSLLKRVSTLPLNSVIFYSLIFQDGNGKKYIPYEMAERIASHANVPVFSHWDPLLGSGIAGGYMLSAKMAGEESGRTITRLLYKSGHDSLQNHSSVFQHFYDWERLKHFHMNLKNLPESSIILHKPLSFYAAHSWQINLGALLLVGLFIIVFFWIRMLRHQVEERTKALKKQKEIAEKQAVIDRLTGLLNRHAMEMLIHEEMGKYPRGLHTMSLLMMDIDHFKQINDTYGHHIGDEVLKSFARTLEPCMENGDYFARWGGEEFIILSLNKSIDGAASFAEQLRSKIDSFRHGSLPSLTISIGVAEYHSGQTFESWYQEVDRLVYLAKEKGRNRVCSEAK
jgi:diguanylate cyclase (GGDEF)-like protein